MPRQVAIYGSLVDMKNVASHKCVRLVVDVPAEWAADIVGMFGRPTRASPIPIAMARMVGEERRPPERSLAQMAGALCNDAVFRAFMQARDVDHCADLVRAFCGVESRSEIKAGTPAGNTWLELVREFDGWKAAERAGATTP